jgi:NADH-quinone oxidoreductase subunit H
MWVVVGIAAVKTLVVIGLVMGLAGTLGWIERKGSAYIQDRVGANRASVFGIAAAGLVNTIMADPLKFLTKEDVIPTGVDRLLHTLAPCVSLFPVLVAFAAIPFGDILQVGGRDINLQAVSLNVGILFILAMVSLGVYGIVLGGWSSNNRFSLLGGIRGSAQMISYEIGMGLSIVAMVMTYGTLDLQEMVRAQGHLIGGVVPAWGIIYQPLAFLIFFMSDFIEIAVVAGLVTTLFFGGWQVPYLLRDGFHFPWGTTLLLPQAVVAVLQIVAFVLKVVFFCWVQVLIRWTLPRLRYDQLMALGWKGLLPISLANVLGTAVVALLLQASA